MLSALATWIRANLTLFLGLVVPLFGAITGGLGYLVRRRLEKSGQRQGLEIEGSQIDHVRKLAELNAYLKQTGQTPESLVTIRERIVAIYGEQPAAGSPIAHSISGMWCSVYVQPRIARAESLSESMSDIVLIFTGGDSLALRSQQLTIELTLNVNIANPIGSDHLTDIELCLDEGPNGNRLLGRGRREGPASLFFENVSIQVPARREARTLRIKNLRAEVAYLGVPGPDTRVLAFFAIHRTDGAPVFMANEMAVLALPQLTSAIKLIRENKDAPLAQVPDRAAVGFYVRFLSVQPNPFRTRSEEDAIGRATNGTRFLLRFYDVPEALRVFVTVSDLPGIGRSVGRAVLMKDADGNGAGGTLLDIPRLTAPMKTRDGIGFVELRVAGGFAFAVWEWTAERAESPDPVIFGVSVGGASSLSNLGPLKISPSLAPVSTVPGFSSGPIPRFIPMGPKIPVSLLAP